MYVTLDQWQAIGIVCGAILALAGVVLLVGKGLSMLWQWRFGNELKATVDRIESAVAEVKEELAEHTRWHPEPGGRPAKAVQPRPNGQRPRR